jgi:hypothetical protein
MTKQDVLRAALKIKNLSEGILRGRIKQPNKIADALNNISFEAANLESSMTGARRPKWREI